MKRGKAKHEDEKPDIFENSSNLALQIAERLEICNEVAEDLMVIQKIELHSQEDKKEEKWCK